MKKQNHHPPFSFSSPSLAKAVLGYLIEAVRDCAVFSLDKAGKITSWNAEAQRITGYKAEEIIGQPLSRFYSNEELKQGKPEQQLQNALDEGRCQEEGQHLRKDGSTFWAEAILIALRDQTGTHVGFATVIRDSSESKRAEQELRHSQERFRTLVDQATDAFFLHDFTGKILDVNRAACESLGYGREELLHLNIVDVESLYSVRQRQQLLDTIKPAQPITAYGQHHRKDGSSFPIEVRLSRFDLNDQRLFLGLVRDITKRKQAEDALRESERHFRQLAESLPQLVWTCFNDGSCNYFSPQWVEYTGIPEQQQLDFGWMAQLHPDDLELTITEWNRAVIDQAIFNVEFRLRRADGVYRWFNTRAVPLRDETGNIIKWFGSNTDIQEQREMREALGEQASRLQVLADASQAFAEAGTDYQALLELIARQTAEALGAFCAIGLRSEDGEWFLLKAMYDVNPELREFIWKNWGALPHRVKDSEVNRRLFEEGQPTFVQTVDLQNLKTTVSPRSWPVLDRLQLKSLIIAPLWLQGRVIGLFYLARHERGLPDFDENDLHLVQDLAGRAALAINNAQLYQGVQAELERRRIAEEALLESQAQLHIALESGGMGTWVWDIQKSTLWWDDSTVKLFGLTREAVADGRLETFAALIHPDDLAHVQEVREKAFREGGFFYDEYRIIRPDGRMLWLSARGRIEKDASGQPLRMTGACVDISERKRAETELRHSEERFSSVFRASPAAFSISRLNDGQMLDVNEKFLSLTGYSREEILGNTAMELGFLKSEERSQLLQSLQKNDGSIRDLESSICTKFGEQRTVLFSLERIDLDYEPCLLSILYDITDRKRAQEAVQRFVACSPAVIYALKVWNDHLQHTWTSENVLDLTGYRPDEAVGLDWWANHLHPDDRERVLAAHAIPYEQEHQILEFRFRRKDGNYFWVRDEKRLRRDAQGKATEVIGSWSDITERVQLEEQLRQSQKMEAIGQLAGGVAHDFNNLLTVIMGYSELLLNELTTEDPRRNHIQNIRQAGERATSLTRQLLAFSRKQMLNPKILDINEVVSHIEKMLRRLIGENILLTTFFSPVTGVVKIDPSQLEQVVINLAVNARDAMPEGGRLTIETQDLLLDAAYCQLHPDYKPGRYTMLSITDTGTGMAPEVKQRIFEPFFTTKEVGKGTGLGLATVFGIVKQSDGYIEAYSEVDTGTSFKIYFPVVESKSESPQVEVSEETTQPGNETILLVEDEEAVRRIAKLILETHGYDVLVASNGQQAILLAQHYQGHIHLLVTDVVMPEMSGSQLAEILLSRQANLKVLFMSGYIDDAMTRQDILTENEAFLQKPFSPLAFARKVREILDQDR